MTTHLRARVSFQTILSQLREKTRQRLTYLGSVVCGAKNQFRRPIISRTDVRYVGLVLHENLGAAKVAQLQNATVGIKEKILRLDVPVTNALGVNVRQGSKKLVGIEFDFQNGHRRLHLVEKARGPVHGLRNEFLHQVEVHLIFLCNRVRPMLPGSQAIDTDSVLTRSPFE